MTPVLRHRSLVRRTLGALLGVVPILALTVAAGCSQALPVGGVKTTGPLYQPGSTFHYCTASVVDSPRGNLLVTAAHCLYGTSAGVTFVPGSVNGSAPYGTWTVTGTYADPAWISSQDPHRDVAFLTVAPQRVNGITRTVQQVTGGNELTVTPNPIGAVVVPGYPAGVGGAPLSCLTAAYWSSGYPTFDCAGYTVGVSGSPWITGSRVVGVIGGPNQGGCTDDRSYSSAFDSRTVALYERAAAGGRSDSLPDPRGDGC